MHATIGIHVSVLLCLEGLVFLVSFITSDSCNLSAPSSTGFPEPQREGFDGDGLFRTECPKVFLGMHIVQLCVSAFIIILFKNKYL